LLNCSSGSGRHLIFIAVAIDQPFFWNVERNESTFEQKILDGSLPEVEHSHTLRDEAGPEREVAFDALVAIVLLSWTPKMRQVAKVEPCP